MPSIAARLHTADARPVRAGLGAQARVTITTTGTTRPGVWTGVSD